MSLRRIIWFPAMLSLILLMEGNLTAQSFYVQISTDDDTEICVGDSVLITLEFTGISRTTPPFNVVINDKDGEYLVLEKITFPYSFYIFPESDNSYYVAEASDKRNRTGAGIGTVDVLVHPYTPVSLIMDRTAFLVTEPGFPLGSDPPGALFSGPGVVGNTFYPELATTQGSPHMISCSLLNQYGCVSSDSREVYVLSGKAAVYLISGNDTLQTFCGNASSCTLRAENEDHLPGTFALFASGSSVPIPGHISDVDLTDNEAMLSLEGLSGNYEIVYTYGINSLEIRATREFAVYETGLAGIRGLPETVCSNDDPYPLVPDLTEEDPGAVYTFYGPGVTGNQPDGFYFDPSLPEVPAGTSEIILEYTSSSGCSTKMTVNVQVGRVPELKFTIDRACLDLEGSTVHFSNQSSNREVVESWYWDFGDPASGNTNYSSLENPDHFYSDPGPKSITLTATTLEECQTQYTKDTLLVDIPQVEFSWSNDCFSEGTPVIFQPDIVSLYSDPDTLIWTISTDQGGQIALIGKDPADPELEFVFSSPGTYGITLYAENEQACQGQQTRSMKLIPMLAVEASGYLEEFNGANPGWIAESGDASHSWLLGEPDFNGFEPVANDLSWYTRLPLFEEGYLEHSWIRSPCFDLSGIENPVIQMDLLKSLTPGMDGAVLQYQSAPGEGWTNVGSFGQGSNWYNDTLIDHMPGGSSEGWSLIDPQPDEQWVTASHPLLIPDGNIPVKFRLAIATEGTREIVPGVFNQGFAFDNFSIGEAILRRSVLEYFTNAAGDLVYEADSAVKHYATEYGRMVFDLHYHMDYPEEDPMNLYNPYPALTRAFNYGVPVVPYAVLNGGVTPDYRYDLTLPSGHLHEEPLLLSASESPSFDLSLSVNYLENRLEGEVTVTCLAELFESNLQLYIVVLEEEVTSYPSLTRDSAFRNVVLDMLPYEGIMLGDYWVSGSVSTRTFEWDYPEYVEDIEDLAVVAFVQDRDDKWIYQAEKVSYTNATAVFDNRDPYASIRLYPNPAGNDLMVYFGDRPGPRDRLVLIDNSGREVINIPVADGSLIQHMDLSRLESGMYMVFWKEGRITRGYAKLIHYR